MQNKRLVLTLGIVAALAFNFWLGSRYPSLNEKAMMGSEIRLEDPLGFDIVVPVERADPLYLKVLKTTINWAKTNQQGMQFGILIAAALMGVFSLLQKRTFKSSIANSSLGIMLGAPLGVCVNCVTPVAQGIHTSGARLETTLAMMIASPTLNMIVVTMLFALFPPYFVVIKLGITLAFILFGIPLMAKILAPRVSDSLGADMTISQEACPIDLSPPIDPNESWGTAALETIKAYFKNLWWIIKTTLPLMALAGFLGAVVITVVPWEWMTDLFSTKENHAIKIFGAFGVALIGVTIVASVGIFLPVPIAFDVMIVAILLGAGMPVQYAMALLFTLGIFSIYPFTVIWKDISKVVAVSMASTLVVLGVIAGLTAMEYYRWDTDRRTAIFLDVFKESEAEGDRKVAAEREAMDREAIRTALAGNENLPTSFGATSDLNVERTPFLPRSGKDGLIFEKIEGPEYGLNEPWDFSLNRFNRPYEYHRSIAAGDVHNDGWPDVAVTSDDHVLSLYANVGGKRFELQQVELPSLQGTFVPLIAMVDMNDDGWLDLFFSTYLKGNWVIYNDEGSFEEANLVQLPAGNTFMTAAASFGDLDKDGDLDAVFGNWSRWERSPESRNSLLLGGDPYEIRDLPSMVGETLSTLFTDYDGDSDLDLIIGNDFTQPDIFYLGDGKGGLQQITRQDGMVPHTTETTMSVTSSDIDNDLKPELYFTQVTGRDTNTEHVREVTAEKVCDALSDAEAKDRCLVETQLWRMVRQSKARRNTLICLDIEDERLSSECVVHHLLSAATRWNRDESYCDFLPPHYADLAFQCHLAFRDRLTYSDQDYADNIPQIRNDNVLLARQGDGFVDKALDLQLGVTGWTWNSKFADLDNDEWVDLFAVNGFFESQHREASYLFRNQEGKGFVDETIESGVLDYFPTSAYTYIDYDHDGDLDIIAVPIHGPIWVYRNESSGGNSIAFQLRDHRGNRYGIGSKIIIHYGDGSHQLRELQSGGGFISFDPVVAHFGLGEHQKVTKVEIEWSTSERTILDQEFDAGSLYIITRPDSTKTAETSWPPGPSES